MTAFKKIFCAKAADFAIARQKRHQSCSTQTLLSKTLLRNQSLLQFSGVTSIFQVYSYYSINTLGILRCHTMVHAIKKKRCFGLGDTNNVKFEDRACKDCVLRRKKISTGWHVDWFTNVPTLLP